MEIDTQAAEKAVKARLLDVARTTRSQLANGVEGVRKANHVKDIKPVYDFSGILAALDEAVHALTDHEAIAAEAKRKEDEKAARKAADEKRIADLKAANEKRVADIKAAAELKAKQNVSVKVV